MLTAQTAATIGIRNAAFNSLGTVDCEIEHPSFGWIPFTADLTDPLGYSPVIYQRAFTLNPSAYVPPPLTKGDYTAAIQALIDAVARAKSYADGVSCASYAASTKPEYAADATAFIAWRDSVWDYAFTQLALVQSAQREQPTVAQLLSELEAPPWDMP